MDAVYRVGIQGGGGQIALYIGLISKRIGDRLPDFDP
jgi:hypothetical protein